MTMRKSWSQRLPERLGDVRWSLPELVGGLRHAGAMTLVAVLAVTLSGCSQIGVLKGQMALKDANQLYQRQDYKGAAVKYEEAIQSNPELGDAYFYLGNSYDNQYRPARRGQPENDQLMDKAIANYRLAVERAPTPVVKQRALQYLVFAYGEEKLNDPSQQEPILKQMIEMDPSDPGNYFVLANVYEQNGDYEQAEQLLLKARDVKPNDPSVYTTLAAFYNRQGEFDKTMDALHARAEKEPNNPEAFYLISTYYWEKGMRDFTISQADKARFVQEGHEAVDKALELKPDYIDALVYKGLLLRLEATVEKDPKTQQALVKEAQTYSDRAVEVRNKQRASGAGD
jgi:tetratricopeptide (TPR) repeat protein